MVYLANCPVEVINVGQGDYFWWERVPVNNSTGKERVFNIVCGCSYLSVCHRMRGVSAGLLGTGPWG